MTPLESKLRALVARITDCLAKGGLFNMDVMEAGKVRDLLIDCRTALANELEALLAVAEPPTVREQLNEMFGKEKVDYAIAEAETGVAEPPALVPGAFDIALAHSAFAPYPDRPPAPRSLSAEQKHEQFLAWWIQQEYRNSYPTSIMRACESAWNGALLSAPRCIGYPDCDGDLEGEPHSEKCLAAALAERQEPPDCVDLRVALERIAVGELNAAVGICNCTHDDENCCEKVGEFCPQCIAATALKLAAAAPSSGTGERK